MRRTLKGFLGMLTVIALVAVAGGFAHAQMPSALQAQNPAFPITDTARAFASMTMKINQQCTDQETGTVTSTAYTVKKTAITEKEIITSLIANKGACTAATTVPVVDKSKLKYKYDGGTSAFIVSVTDGTTTANISSTCMHLNLPSGNGVWSGATNPSATVNSVKASGLYDMDIVINIPTSTGIIVTLAGIGKENVNLPKLPSKIPTKSGSTLQTLTDNWTFSGGGAGTLKGKSVVCTGTAGANGTLKRTVP